MAIIYSYPKNTDILSTDIVLGTSTRNVNGRKKNVAKNFEIGNIATFFNDNSSITVAGQNNYFFQNNTITGRRSGSISFVSGGGTGTPFSNITLLRISKLSTANKNISAYIDTLINQVIIIVQVGNSNNFGIYKCNDILPVISDSNFLDLELEVVNANGAITEDLFYAVAVYPGFVDPNGDLTAIQTTTPSQLTITSSTGPVPSLAIVTAPVIDGSTALATGSQIYDFITGHGFVESININGSTFLSVVNSGTSVDPIFTIDLSATGIADTTTFLRGDNTWDKGFRWFDYIVGKTLSINIIVAGGTVQEFSYAGTTEKRYRFIPSPYDPATDIIYKTFSMGVLSNPISYRLITL